MVLAFALLFAAAVQQSETVVCEQITSGGAVAEHARTQARAMITRTAGSPSAAFLNGCISLGEGKADKAADFFEVAAKAGNKSTFYEWLGRAYGSQAQTANKLRQPFLARKTKAAFEKAVELDPSNISARGLLVQFYQQAPGVMGGSEEKARQQIAEMKARNPYRGGIANAEYFARAKDVAGAEREYMSLTKAYPDSTAPWNGAISMQLSAQRYGDAFATVDLMRVRRPMLADYATGRIAAISGMQLDRGEASLRRYLTTTPAANEPSHASAHYRLAQIMQHRKDVAAARSEYEETLKLQPNHSDARKALASLQRN